MAVGVDAVAAVAAAVVAAVTVLVGGSGHRTCTHDICSGGSVLGRIR